MKQSFKNRLGAFSLFTFLLASLLAGDTFVHTADAQQGNLDRKLIAYAEQISGDTFPVETRTARGVRVFARTQPRAEVLRAIDSGFTELFQIARRHGYTRRLSYTDYTVFIGKADRVKDSQGSYSPDVA